MVKTAYRSTTTFVNRKLCHLSRHNLGSRWKLQKMQQKMARENFSVGAFYNITKIQDNPIKTVGEIVFCAPKPLKYKFLGVTQPPGVAQPLQLDPGI